MAALVDELTSYSEIIGVDVDASRDAVFKETFRGLPMMGTKTPLRPD